MLAILLEAMLLWSPPSLFARGALDPRAETSEAFAVPPKGTAAEPINVTGVRVQVSTIRPQNNVDVDLECIITAEVQRPVVTGGTIGAPLQARGVVVLVMTKPDLRGVRTIQASHTSRLAAKIYRASDTAKTSSERTH